MLLPPTNVPPERLFRTLLAVPRATEAIAFRLDAAPTVAFCVSAVTSLELGEAFAWAEDASPEIVSSRVPQAIVAAALRLTDGRRAFDSPDDVGALDDAELRAVGAVVMASLSRISPTIARSTRDAWVDVLAKGARHGSNMLTAMALGGSADVSLGFGNSVVSPRPDRFFGIPMCELTDGHWFAWMAARKVVDRAQSEKNG